MSVQVLVATMDQQNHDLLDKMNIRSEAIVGNQCAYNSIEKFEYKGKKVVYLNFNEKGVGLNRNNALMRAYGDICLFADDDMVYVDDYVEKVENAFQRYPQADVIIFNLIEKHPTRFVIKRNMRVGYFNFLRYGTARVAVRLSSVREKGIYFNQCFGGGTEHCHGEDNLFLAACLKNGLNIYAVPEYIASLTEERKSSWNVGYGEKYLRDQGVLYKTMTRKWYKFLCLQDAIRHRKSYGVAWQTAYKKMLNEYNK